MRDATARYKNSRHGRYASMLTLMDRQVHNTDKRLHHFVFATWCCVPNLVSIRTKTKFCTNATNRIQCSLHWLKKFYQFSIEWDKLILPQSAIRHNENIWTKKNRLPFDPPDNRNDINDRMTPNNSVVSKVYTFPVFGSGRSSSKLLPREIRNSWDLVPEKLPCTACNWTVFDEDSMKYTSLISLTLRPTFL